MTKKSGLERGFEQFIFASRWLLAPIYLGLVLALAMLLLVFFKELIYYFPQVMDMDDKAVILFILNLIDLALIGSLIVIVIFSGYESMVSKLDILDETDRPYWMGSVDLAGLKIKLIASIIAISAIQLLKYFMKIGKDGTDMTLVSQELKWLIILHLTFVFSGVMMAVMDWLKSRSK